MRFFIDITTSYQLCMNSQVFTRSKRVIYSFIKPVTDIYWVPNKDQTLFLYLGEQNRRNNKQKTSMSFLGGRGGNR